MNRVIKYLFSVLLLSIVCTQLYAKSEIDSLLFVLEETMAQRAIYDAEKNHRIENLKALLQKESISKNQEFFINNQLVDEYLTYTFDSALFYSKRNLQISQNLNDKKLIDHADIVMSYILSSSGKYFEAWEILKNIDSSAIPDELKVDYYEALIKVYNELSFHTSIEEHYHKYYTFVKCYTDSLMPYLPEDSEERLSVIEKQYRDNGNLIEAKKINNQRINLAKSGCRNYAMICFERSLIYQMEGQEEMRMRYLILSAISDIQASVKDNASLTDLALILHEQGDITRANNYIRFSYEDATFFNSELRYKVISTILPVINEAYNDRIESQKKRLRSSILLISILVLLLLGALYFIYKQVLSLRKRKNELSAVNAQLKGLNNSLRESNEKLNLINEELSESNHVKEHYIGNFLTICSNYINKLDQTNKRIYKRISNREVHKLFDETKTIMADDLEIKEFYENFDDTFLHIFPDFVKEINKLLIPEEQFQLKSEERLNTELRIFALIRLGIKDSSRIAKLLRYSVNTIYNYRVKVKNNAKGDRDRFEEQVMNIHVVKD